MKKLTKILAVLLLISVCVAVLTACGPNADPDKAERALKEKEYSVIKDGKKLYTVAMETLLELDRGQVLCVISASKTTKTDDGSVTELLAVVYFDKSATAKAVFENAKEQKEKFVKTAGISKIDENAELVFKRSGSRIYCGTEQAIADAK